MKEVAKNIYVTDSVVTGLLEDPRRWLDGLDGFDVRYVGGIHNLSTKDKKAWTRQAPGPLRIIESGTGREEVWFPVNSKGPLFISLDKDGNLTSHFKYNIPQPALRQDISQKSLNDDRTEDLLVEFSVWYHDNHIHRTDEGGPAIMSSKVRIPIPDDEYIAGVSIDVFREFWKDGEWFDTSIGDMIIVFHRRQLNGAEMQSKAVEWIANNCQGGFFPLSNTLFGDPEEEFLFLTDICSQG